MTSMTGYKSNYGPAGSNVKPQKIAGYELASVPTMSPETADLYKYLLRNTQEGAGKGLQSLTDISQGRGLEALEAPINTQFQKNIGQIASQFSGQGMGGRDSSAFNAAVAGEAAQSAERLGAQRLNLQQNAIRELLAMSKSLLGTDYEENLLIKPEERRSTLNSILAGGLPIAGAVGGGIIGSVVPGIGTVAGATLGAGVGKAAGKAFL